MRERKPVKETMNMRSLTEALLLGMVLCTVGSGGRTGATLHLCAQNGRYVETDDGAALFLIGYLAHNLDLDNTIGYENLLELNARNRVNYMRYFPCCSRMMDTAGDKRWQMFADAGDGKVDLGKWKDGFWGRVRENLTFMRDHGIVAHVSLFEGCTQWDVHPFNPRFNVNTDLGNVDRDGDGNGYEQGEFFDYDALTNPDATPQQKALKFYQERVVGKVLAETSGFPNVMYEIGNELPNPGLPWVQYWVRFVRARCDNLITYNGREGLTEPGFDGATDHVSHEARVTTPFPADLMRVRRFVGSSSDGSEITNIGSDAGRRCLWKAFAAGIGGWMNYSVDFYYNNADEFYYSAESPGRYNLRKGLYYCNAVGFIQDWGLPFPEMAPDQDVIVAKPDGTEIYCLAGKGEYVVYLVGRSLAGKLELDLEPASEHAYWFDPHTGAFCEHVTVKAGRNVLTIPPVPQDLVLYVGRPRTEIKLLGATAANIPSPTVELELRNFGESLAVESIHAEFSNDGLESFRPCKVEPITNSNTRGQPLKVTVRNVPFGQWRAARNWLRITAATPSGRQATATFAIVGSDTTWVDLGEQDVADGLQHVQNNDGRTIGATAAGHACRRNFDPSGRTPDNFFYFAVDNVFAYAGTSNQFQIKVTYLDVSDGTLKFEYDAQGEGLPNIYHPGGSAPFTGTGQWRTHTFNVDDAYFGDRQNVGADFRLFIGQSKTAYIRRVELVRREGED